jgi:hypothetical protein
VIASARPPLRASRRLPQHTAPSAPRAHCVAPVGAALDLPGAWRALIEPQSCPPRPHPVFPHWRHNPPWHPAYRRRRPILRPPSGPEPTNNDPLVIHLSQGATSAFLESMSNPSTDEIQAQWLSPPELASSPLMLPTFAPAPRGHHRSSLASLSVVQPVKSDLAFGGHKVLMVFVPGGSARETNVRIFG